MRLTSHFVRKNPPITPSNRNITTTIMYVKISVTNTATAAFIGTANASELSTSAAIQPFIVAVSQS